MLVQVTGMPVAALTHTCLSDVCERSTKRGPHEPPHRDTPRNDSEMKTPHQGGTAALRHRSSAYSPTVQAFHGAYRGHLLCPHYLLWFSRHVISVMAHLVAARDFLSPRLDCSRQAG